MRGGGQAPLQRSTSGSSTFEIPRLLGLAASGKLRIPDFQRSFVWDASDIRKLFDSIYRGFPIGTLLLWRQPVPAGEVAFGPAVYAAGSDPEGLVVVDGQQRITALIGSLSHGLQEADERFEVFFDLQRKRFVGLARGARPKRTIPVRETVESRHLLTWLRENADELEADDLETADELGGALRDYRVPAYIVESDDEILLREVFDRVNSAGKPISRAQIFHALFANDSSPGSPTTVVKALNNLTGFGDIAENRVVQSLLAIRGGDVQRDLHDEFADDEDPADWYEQTERALGRAISFLKEQGIAHQALMPSSFPLPVLAVFFHLHPEPEEWNRALLARWLWRGWVHGFGREGGQTPSLRRAVRSINPKKSQPHYAPSEHEAVRVLLASVKDAPLQDQLDLRVFRTDNANSRLALVAIAQLQPRSPIDGSRLDLGQMLASFGAGAAGELVRGYRTRVGARSFWLEEYGNLTGSEGVEILRSHAVSSEAADLLTSGKAEVFVEFRSADVVRLTEEFLDGRMQPGSLVRPPLQDLFIPDSDL